MGKTGKIKKHGAARKEKTDRKHLTDREVFMLIDGATGGSRNKERDRCLLLLTYRHGYRVSEICALPLDHVDIEGRVLHVKRLKTRALDHAPVTRRRGEGYQGMAERARPDEATGDR
jgi:site-specific recombinase XerD